MPGLRDMQQLPVDTGELQLWPPGMMNGGEQLDLDNHGTSLVLQSV
jgi:hypothetical protein